MTIRRAGLFLAKTDQPAIRAGDPHHFISVKHSAGVSSIYHPPGSLQIGLISIEPADGRLFEPARVLGCVNQYAVTQMQRHCFRRVGRAHDHFLTDSGRGI